MPTVDWSKVADCQAEDAGVEVDELDIASYVATPQLSYYYRNRDKVLAYQRKRYRHQQVEKRAEGRRKYWENPEKACASARSRYRKVRDSLLDGKVCVRCGFSDLRALQIDHVFGKAKMDRFAWRLKSSRPYIEHIAEELKNNTGKFQVLCANCNWIKRHENNENAGAYYGKRR